MPAIAGTFTDAGYLDLRNYIVATYKYIAIVDSSDAEVMRLEIGVDNRANWTHVTGANPIEVTVNLKGSNAEISKPVTFLKAYLHKTAADTDRIAGGLYTQFTMENDGDTLQIKVQIELPTVVA